jgi:hypothetical protein
MPDPQESSVPSLAATLLLAVHLLAMNVASAGPLVGAWLAWRGEQDSAHSRRVFRTSLYALLVGSLLGGSLLVWPSDGLREALGRFPADAYWFGALELLFSTACMAVLAFGGTPIVRRSWLVGGLAVASATNLLYHFPPLMAVLGELAADPAWAKADVIDRAALLQLWARPEVISLWAHFVFASIAVSCVATMLPTRSSSLEEREEPASRVDRRLGAVALVVSALQIPVGLWLLGTTGVGERDLILGGGLIATLCFGGGVLAALWLLQTLLAVTLGEGRSAVLRSAALLVAVTVLMTATLRATRESKSQLGGAAREQAATAARGRSG